MNKKFVLGIIFLSVVFVIIHNSLTDTTNSIDIDEQIVADYFPNREMIKIFNGGYENSGMTHIIDKVTENKVQIKQVDTGTEMALVYEVTPNEITLIYSLSNSDIKKDYLNTTSNREDIILKGPIKKGTKWVSNDSSYEITDVGVTVKTPAGKFETIEVTHNEGDYVRYYAKGLGLVKTKVLGFDSELIEIDYEI